VRARNAVAALLLAAVAACSSGAPQPSATASPRAPTVAPATSGSAVAGGVVVAPASVNFGATATSARIVVSARANGAAWSVADAPAWLAFAPASGRLGASGARVQVTADRSSLPVGAARATAHVVAGGARIPVSFSVEVTSAPLLAFASPSLTFAVARGGAATKRFELRNVGRSPLTYAATVDSSFVSLAGGESGAVAPGARANIAVRYDYDASAYDTQSATVRVSSNGGDASFVVTGTIDNVPPTVPSHDMSRVVVKSGRQFRRALATITDARGVRIAKVQWRRCTKPGGAAPVCDAWRFTDMKRASGERWTADVGPLPACTAGVGVSVNYRIGAEDGVGNQGLVPGSNIYFSAIHCRQ
jgi:hypothetical protein